MTMFVFNDGIPAAANNPSVDQPDMLTNNQSTEGILAVDHVTFNSVGPAGGGNPGASGGQHLQVTFNGKNVPVGLPTDPISTLYANNVIATATNTASASTVSALFYRNQNGTLPVSMIKAFGLFDGGGNPLNTYNLSITLPGGHPATGLFIIDIPPNTVTGTNYLVFSSTGINLLTPNRSAVYSILGATQFELAFRNTVNNLLVDPDTFSVLIMQL